MAKTHDEARIREALDILNSVAADEKDRLKGMISERYDSLRDFAVELGEGAQRRVANAYSTGKEKAKELADDVDESVHANPWAYIGGAAAIALLIGFVLGRSRR